MSHDLTAFLAARLDEDEAAAKAATPGPWRWGDWTAHFGTPEEYRDTLEHSPEHGPFPAIVRREAESTRVLSLQEPLEVAPDQEASALHVARHDPARTLREVEAGRRILAEHSPVIAAPSLIWCARCHHLIEDAREDEEGCGPIAWPCPTLRAFGAIYSDHPDYRPEWKPAG